MQSEDTGTSLTSLLIKLPCGTIRRVRSQPEFLPISRLQDAVECKTGFPSDIYQLKYGEQWLSDDTSNPLIAHNGALLQLVPKTEWRLLYETVIGKSCLATVLRVCNQRVSLHQCDVAMSPEHEQDSRDSNSSISQDNGLTTTDSCSDNNQIDSFRLFVAICLLCRLRQPDVCLLEQLLRSECV